MRICNGQRVNIKFSEDKIDHIDSICGFIDLMYDKRLHSGVVVAVDGDMAKIECTTKYFEIDEDDLDDLFGKNENPVEIWWPVDMMAAPKQDIEELLE